MLTKKMLDEMEPGMFAHGTVSDNPQGINMSNSNKLLIWAAVRGDGPDWAVYVCLEQQEGIFGEIVYNSIAYCMSNGDKVYNKENVKKLVPCDKEALERYRD